MGNFVAENFSESTFRYLYWWEAFDVVADGAISDRRTSVSRSDNIL